MVKAKPKKHKKQLLLSKSEFARKLEISPAAVTRALKSGRIKSQKKGTREFIELYSQKAAFRDAPARKSAMKRANGSTGKQKINGKKTAADEADDSANNEFYQRRAQLELIKIERAKLELAEKQGLMVPYSEVKKEWLGVAENLKKNILAIPSRIGALVGAHSKKGRHECEQIILKELKRSLQTIGE